MVDELGRMLIPEPIAATARCYESADIDVRNAFREQMRPLVATLTTERDELRAKVDSQRILVDFVPGEMLAAAERRIAELEKGPLTGYQHPWGTCDWGECDKPATEWRWFENDLMHYPVCEAHELQTELQKAQDDRDRYRDALEKAAHCCCHFYPCNLYGGLDTCGAHLAAAAGLPKPDCNCDCRCADEEPCECGRRALAGTGETP